MPEKESPKGDQDGQPLPQPEIDRILEEEGLRVGGIGGHNLDPEISETVQQDLVINAQNRGVPPVVGEGVPDEGRQTEVDLTLVDSRDLDVHIPVLPADAADPEGGLLAEQMPGDGHDPIDPDTLDAAVEAALLEGPGEAPDFEDSVYEPGLGGEQEQPTDYTEEEFRKAMKEGTYISRLLRVFDSLKGAEVKFRSDIGFLESDNIRVYGDQLSIFSDVLGDVVYKINERGSFVAMLDYTTEDSPLEDIKSTRDTVRLLQRAFLTYHNLLDEKPEFETHETRFLDASTCLNEDHPFKTAYKKLSERQNKVTGHEIVTLNNDRLSIEVYNPGDTPPIFSAEIGCRKVSINFNYEGFMPITFETISRGLDTLELGYKAFMGLGISAKPDK